MRKASTCRDAKSEKRRGERGVSMIEVAIASLLLVIGLVGAMMLIPLAIQSNMRNRVDSTSVVIAQRLLNQMLAQPLDSTEFFNADGQLIRLGTSGAGIAGGPLVIFGDRARVDFSSGAVTSYSLDYLDLNDARQPIYEVRWAVITAVAAGKPVAKRYVVGVRMRNVHGELPVTLEGMVLR